MKWIANAAIVPAVLAVALAVPPRAALAQAPATEASPAALADAVAGQCSRVTWDELNQGNGPNLEACLDSVRAAFAAALVLAAAAQEVIGLGFVRAIRDSPPDPNVPVPFPAVAILFAAEFERQVFQNCTPAGMPRIIPSTETCTATVRVLAVADQAEPTEYLPIHGDEICSAVQLTPAWRSAVFAVIDELVARAATGTDTVMQGRIDVLGASVAACPVV